MPPAGRVPFVAREPRLLVAEQDQDVRRRTAPGEVAVVMDVVGWQEGRDVAPSQCSVVGEFHTRRRTVVAQDPPAPMRLDSDDRADRDPRPMIVDCAHLALGAMHDGQPRSTGRGMDRDGAALPIEPPHPRSEVVEIRGKLDERGTDRGEIRLTTVRQGGDAFEQRSNWGVEDRPISPFARHDGSR